MGRILCLVFAFSGCGPVGGAILGPPDMHCGELRVAVDPAACGVSPAGATAVGPVRDGQESDDDGCKFHLLWTSTPIGKGEDVRFVLQMNAASDGSLVLGAQVRAEVSLGERISSQQGAEFQPGNYSVGPFDMAASGDWTIRFWINEQCADTVDSPRGQAAFWVRVP